jgi:hypothetical protein
MGSEELGKMVPAWVAIHTFGCCHSTASAVDTRTVVFRHTTAACRDIASVDTMNRILRGRPGRESTKCCPSRYPGSNRCSGLRDGKCQWACFDHKIFEMPKRERKFSETGLHTIFAVLVLVLGAPRILTLRTLWLRHGLVAAFIFASVPVLVWWTLAGVVGAVVDLATRAAGLGSSDHKARVG